MCLKPCVLVWNDNEEITQTWNLNGRNYECNGSKRKNKREKERKEK